ncbi:hypothetical protein M404DRAFT_760724 [Pisolithus tinctorius Marx 270]|uniref:Uncharacterized protein n=1 Tax=Pisolithus tinctorius Marx 270 TaxID=870435 RepID=A0A0C3NZM8_PISTI|nr:hypothetical protein M404DRAFT_760724 [Pisolithus tinctorius Marx 270]
MMSTSVLLRAPLSKTFASTAGCRVLRSLQGSSLPLRFSYSEQSFSVRHAASASAQYVPGGRTYSIHTCLILHHP